MTIIKGDNGRSYEERNGRLQEVFIPAEHAQRQLDAITDQHTLTGVRLVDPALPDDPAVVLTFDRDEAEAILTAIKTVLKRRSAQN